MPIRKHALVSMQWSGEHGRESTSTATCRCGWSESTSSQRESRFEYRQHLLSLTPMERFGNQP